MKTRKYLWIVLILAVSATWFVFYKLQGSKNQPRTPATNSIATDNSSIQISASEATQANSYFATNSASNAVSNFKNIAAKYGQGLVDKGAVMQAALLAENEKSQDLFGKVIDQAGNPLSGVSVVGELVLNDGTFSGIKIQKYSAVTDQNGLFEFMGIHGAGLGVRANKDGYLIGGHGEAYKAPVSGKSNPDDRAIYTMWKLRGAEPLTSSGIDAKIPYDGSATTFDIATGKEMADGDLRLTLSRLPLEVERGRGKFDWTVKIEMLHGGLLQENDPYPYWAPESGYQPSFEFNMSSNNVPWQSKLEQSFYIKSSQGQYGKMQFGIYSALTPARIQVDFTINPSGSQNLEPDFSK